MGPASPVIEQFQQSGHPSTPMYKCAQTKNIGRSTDHAEGDCECRRLPRVALQLNLHHAAAAPAGRLVDVNDAVCADCVLVHQPPQLDEEPVRVGVLLLRAVELFQALGGLLGAQTHATQEPLHLSISSPH